MAKVKVYYVCTVCPSTGNVTFENIMNTADIDYATWRQHWDDLDGKWDTSDDTMWVYLEEEYDK